MTEHLPIQRWTKIFTRYPASEVLPSESGEYVTYADHLAALRACEERVEESMDRAWNQTVQLAVAHTRTATLSAAREAVEAIPAPYKVAGDYSTYGSYHEGKADFKDLVVSAIDALRKDGND